MVIYLTLITIYYISLNATGIALNVYGKRFNVKRNYAYQPTVSVAMSCFNEGEAVYHTIKSMRFSDYPPEKLQIIVFDDCSHDDSFVWIETAARDFSNLIVRKNTINRGKACNVLNAAELANGEVLVCIDSDCIFEPNAITELMACFSEPNIAAVGGRIGVSNANTNWLTRFQAMAYALSFLVIKSPEKLFRKIQCLSGPLVAIRRKCFDEIKEEIKGRNFFGIKIMNGEDRALTQMLLMKGYDTYLNTHALCYTNVPTSLTQYLKQQLRWRRSAVGQYFQAIIYLVRMIKNSGVLSAAFSLMPIFVLLAWNMIVFTAFVAGNGLVTVMAIVLCHLAFDPCIVLIFYYYVYRSNHHDLKTISLFDMFFCRIFASFWYPVSTIVITLFALFTLDDGGWVTRGESEQLP